MSFSSEVKKELCKIPADKTCCVLSELYGILLFGQAFGPSGIRIVSEYRAFAHRLPLLLKTKFGFGFDIRITPENKNGKMVSIIKKPEKINTIMDAYGYSFDKNIALHLNLAMLEEDCCRASFLRGAFLSGGSVMNPEKRYHLELVTSHYSLSREVSALLNEMEFSPRQTTRKSNYVIYFKASEYIEDFLTTIGAPVSSIALMETKVEKEFRNRINRQVNCETANLTKTVDASRVQIEAIKRIMDRHGREGIPESLRETAVLRLRYPEATLSELALKFSSPVGRSGLNHRLRKLMSLSRSLAQAEVPK
jgi:DNA-binding protein WhiA